MVRQAPIKTSCFHSRSVEREAWFISAGARFRVSGNGLRQLLHSIGPHAILYRLSPRGGLQSPFLSLPPKLVVQFLLRRNGDCEGFLFFFSRSRQIDDQTREFQHPILQRSDAARKKEKQAISGIKIERNAEMKLKQRKKKRTTFVLYRKQARKRGSERESSLFFFSSYIPTVYLFHENLSCFFTSRPLARYLPIFLNLVFSCWHSRSPTAISYQQEFDIHLRQWMEAFAALCLRLLLFTRQLWRKPAAVLHNRDERFQRPPLAYWAKQTQGNCYNFENRRHPLNKEITEFISCLAHSVTPPPPSYTHMFTHTLKLRSAIFHRLYPRNGRNTLVTAV